jgi:hypothetical protein
MADEGKKTRSGRDEATYGEGETAPGVTAGVTPEPAVPPGAAPASPSEPSVGVLGSVTQQALHDFQQILASLAVVGPPAQPSAIEKACPERDWCLPDVSCSARHTMTTEAKKVFDQNLASCPSTPSVG